MTPLDVSPLVSDEFNVGPLVLRRSVAPTRNAYGEMVRATPAVSQLNPVAVHNIVGRDLLQVPEADRNSENIELYTLVRLFVATDNMAPDVVEYRGRRWLVTQCADFDLQGGVFISTAVLEDTQGSGD